MSRTNTPGRRHADRPATTRSKIGRGKAGPPKGAAAPAPASTFAELGIPPAAADALAARTITVPTAIQIATIPEALAGRDVCGRAPTGSGKTIAFGLPLVLGVSHAGPKRPRGLVLVPTRELAAQVTDELRQLAAGTGRTVEAVYGGVGFGNQLKALRRGVDIIVACPGRLADLVAQGACDLSRVEVVVIDEADRLADMGFLPEVRRLLDRCTDRRQTLLFSATLDGDVDVLIRRYQHDPARHDCSGPDDHTSAAEHHFWAVERPQRISTTARVVAQAGPTVVFCRTKRGADRVARQLAAAGVPAAAIHGDRSQAQRERALSSFHRGQVAALVATDVAARGIHVDGVACVIHFDPPADPKDYVHRSGRTARAGASGIVVTVVPADQRAEVRKLQGALGFPSGITAVDPTLLGPGVPAPRRPAESRHDDGAPRSPKPKPKPRSKGPASAGRPGPSRASRAGSGPPRSRRAASGRRPQAVGGRSR